MLQASACIDKNQGLGIEITRLALWNHRIERRLAAESGLPVNELHCIMKLHLEEPGSAGALAELLGIRDTSLSKLLRSLERRGAVNRYPDSLDHRIEHVSLSEWGIRIAMRTIARAGTIGEEVLAALPEERRDQFLRCLGVMTVVGSSIISLDPQFGQKASVIPTTNPQGRPHEDHT